MNIQQIILEIRELPIEDHVEIFKHLEARLNKVDYLKTESGKIKDAQIIREINQLPIENQKELYSILDKKIKRYDHLISFLDKIRGSGRNIWNQDAQEYINELRADDRV